MKIEKVNDHQIRCTLTKADLADRELKISELAYGTEKAKSLFRDMMQQASFEVGFDAADIPLMIEAITLNSECIVLVITKVEDPEELDTRFSKFAPSVHEDVEDEEKDGIDDLLQNLTEGADDVLDLFKKIHEGKATDGSSGYTDKPDMNTTTDTPKTVAGKKAVKDSIDLVRIYSFDSLNQVIRLSHVLVNYYQGKNSLYKNGLNSSYILVITQSGHTPEEFNRICNMISEYGNPEKLVSASEAFMEEHYETIMKDNAVQSLSLV